VKVSVGTIAIPVVVLVVAAVGVWKVYLVPRAALLEEEATLLDGVRWYEEELGGAGEVRRRLEEFAATTLGSDSDEIEHTFRARLGELAREAGLEGVVVSSGAPDPVSNPAGEGRGRVRGRLGDLLRESPDAWVMGGSIRGEGSLEAVASTVAVVGAQAWVHRMPSFTIKPVGKARDRFELRVEVATLIVPDLIGEDFEPPRVVTLGELDAGRWMRIAERNVFAPPREPSSPEPAAAEVAQAEPPPPPPPFGEWKLTGVARGVEGPEALLWNTRTGERRRLVPGDSLLGARLVGVSVDGVTFELEEERFAVRLGGTLEEREPA